MTRSKSAKYLIYLLIDPQTHVARYVGKSSNGIHRAGQPHDHGRVGPWIKRLAARGLAPDVVVLEEVPNRLAPGILCWWRPKPQVALDDAECWWIAFIGRNCRGGPLLNATDGGDGASYGADNPMANPAHREKALRNRMAAFKGYTPETLAKMSASALARGNDHHFRSPIYRAEQRERMLEANPMKNPDSVAKGLKARRGLKQSEEACANIAAGAKRRWNTPEMKEFMRGPNNPSKSPEARARIAAARRASAKPQPPCGTARSYYNARARKLRGAEHCGPCKLCTTAVREVGRDRRDRKKARNT